MEKNQDKIKDLNFKGVQQVWPCWSSLPLSSVPTGNVVSWGDILLEAGSSTGISGLTQNRKSPRSPESLISRDFQCRSAVLRERERERSIWNVWCPVSIFFLVSHRFFTGSKVPFVAIAGEISLLVRCPGSSQSAFNRSDLGHFQ